MRDIKERLSLLWIFALLNYLYADVVALFAIVGSPNLADAPHLPPWALLGSAVLMEIPSISGNSQLIPVFGVVHIARTQLLPQAVPVTIEQKQRVVADRLKVPVVGAALLLTMNRTLAGVHVEHDTLGAIKRLGLPQRLPVQRH
ncbi:MAG: hypothetical protein WCA91_21795 [Candidatus Acidiferrales bacterium]